MDWGHVPGPQDSVEGARDLVAEHAGRRLVDDGGGAGPGGREDGVGQQVGLALRWAGQVEDGAPGHGLGRGLGLQQGSADPARRPCGAGDGGPGEVHRHRRPGRARRRDGDEGEGVTARAPGLVEQLDVGPEPGLLGGIATDDADAHLRSSGGDAGPGGVGVEGEGRRRGPGARRRRCDGAPRRGTGAARGRCGGGCARRAGAGAGPSLPRARRRALSSGGGPGPGHRRAARSRGRGPRGGGRGLARLPARAPGPHERGHGGGEEHHGRGRGQGRHGGPAPARVGGQRGLDPPAQAAGERGGLDRERRHEALVQGDGKAAGAVDPGQRVAVRRLPSRLLRCLRHGAGQGGLQPLPQGHGQGSRLTQVGQLPLELIHGPAPAGDGARHGPAAAGTGPGPGCAPARRRPPPPTVRPGT